MNDVAGGKIMNGDNLIKMAVQGDKAAFAGLYALYKDRLYRYAYFKLRNDSDAQDAVADCILCAYKNVSSLKNEKAFDAWIFKILYRSCCTAAKRQITEKAFENPDKLKIIPSDENIFVSAELCEALDALNQTDREIVLLSVVAGFNSRETGRLLKMNPNTVRSRLSRSLAKMKVFLG